MSDKTEITPTPEEKASGSIPEAPAIVFTQLYGKIDGQVIQFNVTCRADTLQNAIDDLFVGCRYARDQYNMTFARPGNPAPEPAPARQAPAPAGSNGGAATGIYHAIKLDIAPEADDKVTLKWYEAGHQYPDISSKRTTAKALELLQSTGEAWEEKDLYRVSTRQVSHAVYWRESEKLNSKGKPYRDIVQIVSG